MLNDYTRLGLTIHTEVFKFSSGSISPSIHSIPNKCNITFRDDSEELTNASEDANSDISDSVSISAYILNFVWLSIGKSHCIYSYDHASTKTQSVLISHEYTAHENQLV